MAKIRPIEEAFGSVGLLVSLKTAYCLFIFTSYIAFIYNLIITAFLIINRITMPSFRVNNRGHIFFTDQSGKVSLRSYSMSRLRDSCGRLFQSTSRSAYSGNRIMTIDGAMSIKRGDRIFTEKPFVFALKSVYRKERCDFCLKQLS